MNIEKIKLALTFAFSLQSTLSQVLRDGKVKWTEFMMFFPVLSQVDSVFGSIKEIKEELTDLDEKEKEALKQFVADRFDIENEQAEEKIEKSINLLIEIVDFVYDVK